jgi:predicted DNA repair protein MutK
MNSGFFSILDDIATLMDDVAINAKIATKKTAGILGDDLAVNAEKSTGFVSSREIPVLWAITKGSFLNKIIIVPITLLLHSFFPAAINIILILGGFYLAYEGIEKIVVYFINKNKIADQTEVDSDQSEAELEKVKIKSAITTDFILSIEIVIIALSTVLNQNLGVYGIVALIVRMDDVGLKIIEKSNNKGVLSKIGWLLVEALPLVIRIFAIVGTIALLLVSGSIFAHNITYTHHLLLNWPIIIKEFVFGIIGGIFALALITIFKKISLMIKTILIK